MGCSPLDTPFFRCLGAAALATVPGGKPSGPYWHPLQRDLDIPQTKIPNLSIYFSDGALMLPIDGSHSTTSPDKHAKAYISGNDSLRGLQNIKSGHERVLGVCLVCNPWAAQQ